MSKPDWGALQQRFIAAHTRSGISPAAWCEEIGLNYATARRYIKKPPKTAQEKLRKTTQKIAQKDGAQTAQKRAENLPEKNLRNFTEADSVNVDDSVFDPADFGISEQQGVFAQHVAMGKTLTGAYRLAGYQGAGATANSNASRMLRNAKVSRAVRWLRDKRQRRLALTEAEIIHQLSSIASLDANELTQFRRVNCRYCWGDDHQYQWKDIDEYEHACALALKEEKAPPEFGGVGFVDSAAPHPECPRCYGEGEGQPFFADTTMLDGPARWAYLGVEETMNGLKVKYASPEAARKELLAHLKATRNIVPGKEELELERMRLVNEKARLEIEVLKNEINPPGQRGIDDDYQLQALTPDEPTPDNPVL
ncbi:MULTISPECIES: terminase small subunit [Enterobacterales]|uniref:terminase small subunit n=1 Tax=Enterobacterales TaxID=91347 RepID=UPI002EDA4EED